jgi:hypothetical protein
LRHRRPKPDYNHIRELEISTGMVDAPAPKREMVPATARQTEHHLTTIAATLDRKTGGYVIDRKSPGFYRSAMSSAYAPVPIPYHLVPHPPKRPVDG